MKRLFATLTVLMMLVGFSSFANDKVTPQVEESFKTAFKSATDVNWSVSQTMYKASFSMNGQYVSAYYNGEGHLLAVTRNLSSLQLPITLQTNLKKNYEKYWISDLFEVASEQGTTYYVTIEDADTKIVLQSSNADWTTYQKQRKS
jgi:hypothetical protein